MALIESFPGQASKARSWNDLTIMPVAAYEVIENNDQDRRLPE
jgi:hypothetical protein